MPLLLGGSPDEIEAQFYEALQRGDLDRLMSLWSDDDDIVCIHPGGLRAVGAAAIRASFAAIFEQGGIPVAPEQVRRLQQPAAALHHLVERIQAPGAQGPQTAWIMASNFFVKTAQGWRLAAHHASPALPQAPAPGAEPPAEAPALLH